MTEAKKNKKDETLMFVVGNTAYPLYMVILLILLVLLCCSSSISMGMIALV